MPSKILGAHRLFINGWLYDSLIAPFDTLYQVLRYQLDLIGVKQGCDKGDCGACTVFHKPAYW